MKRSVSITVFGRFTDPHGHRHEANADEFVDLFRRPLESRATAKRDLRAWSGSVFEGDERRADAFERANVLGFDVDVDPVPDEDALRAGAPFAGFYHSTSSHKPSAPRWRVVFYLDRPVASVGEFRRVWRGIVARLGFKVGTASKDPSRQFFVPREPDEGAYVFGELAGEPVNVDEILEATAEEDDDHAAPIAFDFDPVVDMFVRRENLDAAAALLAPAFVEGKRHELSHAIAGACAWSGLSSEKAFDLLREVARRGPCENEDPAKRREIVERTYERASNGGHVSGWPRVRELAGAERTDHAREVLFGFPTTFAEKIRKALETKPAANDTQPSNPLGVVFGGLDEEPPPVEYLVHGIIPRASVCMFIGEGYSLKTWNALSIATDVDRGTPWLGRHTTRKGRAVILNYEMADGTLRRRLRLLGAEGVGRRTHPDFAIYDPRLWSALEQLGADLVVIDSLSAGQPDVDENDVRASQPLKLASKFANSTGAAVVFIHHANKNGTGKNRIRGTSALYNALDVCFDFEPVDGTTLEKRARIKNTKMREGTEPDPFVVTLTDARGLELFDERSEVDRPPPHLDLSGAVRHVLATKGPDVPEAIAKVIGKRRRDVDDALRIMKQRGEIVVIDRRYHLDGKEQREARVLGCIAEAAREDMWRPISTSAKLAKAANVDTADVLALERAGKIGRSSDDGNGTWFAR